jgi:hypothetical protein
MRQDRMNQAKELSHTQLFTVRLWREDLGAGQTEWRGEVHDVLSGERRYFRDGPALLASLQALIDAQEPDGQQIGSQNEPQEQGDLR